MPLFRHLEAGVHRLWWRKQSFYQKADTSALLYDACMMHPFEIPVRNQELNLAVPHLKMLGTFSEPLHLLQTSATWHFDPIAVANQHFFEEELHYYASFASPLCHSSEHYHIFTHLQYKSLLVLERPKLVIKQDNQLPFVYENLHSLRIPFCTCRQAAYLALMRYPGGMQVGGGVTAENAERYLEAGASHVIVTSYVFRDGHFNQERLQHLVSLLY